MSMPPQVERQDELIVIYPPNALTDDSTVWVQ